MRPGMRFDLLRCLGMAMIASAMVAQAQGDVGLPDTRLGTRIAPILLLTRLDIRTELSLTPAQISEAERMISDLQDKAQPLRGQAGVEADRARTEIDRTSQRWLTEHLSPAQQTRLIQLDLQWEGPSALLSRLAIAESLQLTQAQRVGLSTAIAERNTKRRGGSAIAADEIHLFRTALTLLTEEQKANWRAMLGPIAPFQTAIHPMREHTIRR